MTTSTSLCDDQGVLFRMFELQAKWIAQVLSGKVFLPSEEEMLADVEDHNRQLEEAGIPKRHTHRLDPQVNPITYLFFKIHFSMTRAKPVHYCYLVVFFLLFKKLFL